MKSILRIVPAIFITCISAAAMASCPDGQYEQCVGPRISAPHVEIYPKCACLPNSGTVVNAAVPAINPIPDALNLFGAVTQGNIQQAYSSIGAMVTKAACPTCEIALNIYANQQDKAVIEEIIGRGWLVFASDQPELLLVNPAGTQSQSIPLTEQQSPIPSVPEPRHKKEFLVNGANCVIVHKVKHQAAAGWVDPPTLTDSKAKSSFVFPNGDLRAGDTIRIGSDDKCPVVPSGDSHVKSTKITFDYANVVATGSPTNMKYFFVGHQ